MTFEPFDVVVVPFPFSDREATRRRPALVVSSPDFNATHDQSILAMITSAGGGDWPSDVAIRDWYEAGLSVPCKVRLKLFTLDDTLILRKTGALSERDAEAVRNSLVRFLVIDEGGSFAADTVGTYASREALHL